ncbi:MAG: hypothetical protein KME17_21000 [Cyanosarcina radialis HA8281-LM2]|jgi:hypothetical protein|nr:hypothetical protein [Cyanosarcina radialis HA8281-LM2]
MLDPILLVILLGIVPIAFLISVVVLLAVAYTGWAMVEIVEQVDELL